MKSQSQLPSGLHIDSWIPICHGFDTVEEAEKALAKSLENFPGQTDKTERYLIVTVHKGIIAKPVIKVEMKEYQDTLNSFVSEPVLEGDQENHGDCPILEDNRPFGYAIGDQGYPEGDPRNREISSIHRDSHASNNALAEKFKEEQRKKGLDRLGNSLEDRDQDPTKDCPQNSESSLSSSPSTSETSPEAPAKLDSKTAAPIIW